MAADNAEFLRASQRAVEQMREMHRKSELKAPDFLRYPDQKPPSGPGGNPSGNPSRQDPAFSLPDRLKREPDLALIGGLLLLLWSENADRKLLMALLYILL